MEILIVIIVIAFITHLMNLRFKFMKAVITKSLIMILIVGLSIWANIDKNFPLYGIFICIALITSLIGDIFLALDGSKFFYQGLISFVIAHLFYITTFLVFNSSIEIISVQVITAFVILCLLACLFYGFLYKKPQKNENACFNLYNYHSNNGFFVNQSIMVSFCRRFSFLISDCELAIHNFHQKIPYKSIVNGIFYFPAQFIFALSIFLLYN